MASVSTVHKFVRKIEDLGWQVERTRHNHFKCLSPFDPKVVIIIISGTPSSGRAMANSRSLIRRAYRVAKLELPDLPLG